MGIFTRGQIERSEFPKTTCYWEFHFDRLSAGIVDFVSIKQKLIIELDGSQHLEQEEYDNERTRYFHSVGYKVLRFWNNAVMNDMNGVIRAIELAMENG